MDYQEEMATYGGCEHGGNNELEVKEQIIGKLLKIMKKYDKNEQGVIKNKDVKTII